MLPHYNVLSNNCHFVTTSWQFFLHYYFWLCKSDNCVSPFIHPYATPYMIYLSPSFEFLNVAHTQDSSIIHVHQRDVSGLRSFKYTNQWKLQWKFWKFWKSDCFGKFIKKSISKFFLLNDTNEFVKSIDPNFILVLYTLYLHPCTVYLYVLVPKAACFRYHARYSRRQHRNNIVDIEPKKPTFCRCPWLTYPILVQ